MTTRPYIFKETQYAQELERLQTIEQVFDLTSHQRIQATGITVGWHCLEVGAGAGSMTRWMSSIVGDQGKVVAVDLDTRFIAHLAESDASNIEVLEADIRHIPLESHTFDLVHCRCVLIHIPDFQVALAKMLDLLKPGGWLVLEEPDFSAARAIAGEPAACESVNRVNRAIDRMFANRGMDYALGVKLPAIVQGYGVEQLSVENDVPLSTGGSGFATVMRLSALQLAEKYIATGEATQLDIDRYCQFAEDPTTWAIYHGTVGVSARKPVLA